MGPRAAPGEDATRGRTPRREQLMSIEYTPGPLLTASRTTPTVLWNDSADPDELRQSISFGCVGATCNPTIAYTCINQKKDRWLPHIAELAEEMPEATESEIGWQVVREMSSETL